MAYIGNVPAEQYATLAKQTITGNGGASYTLDYAVANEQEIEVFVNNVRQEPGVAYTVSGTALTMTGNVASTDDFYVVFQGKTVGTIVPGDDTITTAMLKDGSVTTAKIGATSLNLSTIKDSTGTNTALSIDSNGYVTTANRPAFNVYRTTQGAEGDYTTPTLVEFEAKRFDTTNSFDLTTSSFTAPVSGLYFFNSIVMPDNIEGAGWLTTTYRVNNIQVSETDLPALLDPQGAAYVSIQHTEILQLNANDVVTVFYECIADTTTFIRLGSSFKGYLIG